MSALGGITAKAIDWYFEPHVAEQIMDDWLKQSGVQVFFEQPLGVHRKAGQFHSPPQERHGRRILRESIS